MSKKNLEVEWMKHMSVISAFFTNNDYDEDHFAINKATIYSIITKIDQRKHYFKVFHKLKISEYKEVALLAFWYVKLRPLSIRSQDGVNQESSVNTINEKLAVYHIFTILRSNLKFHNLDEAPLDNLQEEYVEELIYSLMYQDLAKEALILLVESMAACFGLFPYEKTNK